MRNFKYLALFLLSINLHSAWAQSFSFSLNAPTIQSNTTIDLRQTGNQQEGLNIDESSFISAINLQGAANSTDFCDKNQTEFSLKSITCSPVNSDQIRLTMNTLFNVSIPSGLSSLRFSLFSEIENISNGFTSVKVDGSTITTSATIIPRFNNIGTAESGVYPVAIEIEMPFKGLNFKNQRNSFLNFYLQVSDL